MKLRIVALCFALAALGAAIVVAQPAAANRPGTRAPSAPAPATLTIETGEINGAKFTVARPARWNRALLILAHGLRGEDRPLVADLFPEHHAYKTLLEEGWMIAKTSYRRNGLIIHDAIEDIDALRADLVARHGAAERVLLEGESMGGLIVTLIAEREPETDEKGWPKYAGAIAIGAALQLREPGATPGLSLQAKIPLLFLTNRSELEGPRNYLAADISRSPALQPVIFRVARDGHVNVNQHERLVALRAMNAWLEQGRSSLPRPAEGALFFDATVAPAPQPSQVTLHPDARGFDARVIEVSAIYGNVFINAQPEDFARAGMKPMAWLRLTAGGQTFRVLHGRDFDSVKRSEWVTFPNADGFFWLARNYADAATTAKLKVGDIVTLRRFDDAE